MAGPDKEAEESQGSAGVVIKNRLLDVKPFAGLRNRAGKEIAYDYKDFDTEEKHQE